MKLFLPIALFFAPLVLHTGVGVAEVRLGTDIITQARVNNEDQRELPFNGYFGGGVSTPDGKISADSDFRIFRDFERSFDDFDLYQTVLHARPGNLLEFHFGRQFLNPGFSTGLLDGLQVTLKPTENFNIGTYGGLPRNVEEGDFQHQDQLLSGLFLDWRNGSGFQARLSGAWRKNDDELRVGSSLSYLFKGSMRPLVSGLVEYETGSKRLETGTIGFDLTPASWVTLGIEGNYFNASRETTRRSILSLFSTGELISGRIFSTGTVLPNLLDLTGSYAYQRMEVREGDRRGAHLAEVVLPFSVGSLELDFGPQYSFAKSFGGDVHGIRFFLHKTVFKKGYGEFSVDYATYDKITSDNDQAFSTIAWTGYEFPHHLRLSIGGEYNRNNILEQDVRGSMKLEYRYGSDI
ncbi:MAG: hypothetical protein HYY44_02825 [Deltaproteobacteria bacterium]|nr:hypothetical protein [Deltaproteobacteria bacterium]